MPTQMPQLSVLYTIMRLDLHVEQLQTHLCSRLWSATLYRPNRLKWWLSATFIKHFLISNGNKKLTAASERAGGVCQHTSINKTTWRQGLSRGLTQYTRRRVITARREERNSPHREPLPLAPRLEHLGRKKERFVLSKVWESSAVVCWQITERLANLAAPSKPSIWNQLLMQR